MWELIALKLVNCEGMALGGTVGVVSIQCADVQIHGVI